MKPLKNLLFCFVLTLSTASWAEDLPNPDGDTLANLHLKDQDCAGGCHENEGPSEDLEFETNSCSECHDELGKVEGKQHNQKHLDEEMPCIECHMPHEETDPKELCADCHDEGHEALEVFNPQEIDKQLLQSLKTE
ncbi:cytochrome c3 family protein [Psychromonas ossibalaenae]|uniref:cytochrome c3 family protein n=1 Tax=Psychromonas ossibalaenae TaxID=444922 RepID=UPI00037D4E00|nr:cytochrome c3 family protein [Psychromonas ossibalaenae]